MLNIYEHNVCVIGFFFNKVQLIYIIFSCTTQSFNFFVDYTPFKVLTK